MHAVAEEGQIIINFQLDVKKTNSLKYRYIDQKYIKEKICLNLIHATDKEICLLRKSAHTQFGNNFLVKNLNVKVHTVERRKSGKKEIILKWFAQPKSRWHPQNKAFIYKNKRTWNYPVGSNISFIDTKEAKRWEAKRWETYIVENKWKDLEALQVKL